MTTKKENNTAIKEVKKNHMTIESKDARIKEGDLFRIEIKKINIEIDILKRENLINYDEILKILNTNSKTTGGFLRSPDDSLVFIPLKDLIQNNDIKQTLGIELKKGGVLESKIQKEFLIDFNKLDSFIAKFKKHLPNEEGSIVIEAKNFIKIENSDSDR